MRKLEKQRLQELAGINIENVQEQGEYYVVGFAKSFMAPKGPFSYDQARAELDNQPSSQYTIVPVDMIGEDIDPEQVVEESEEEDPVYELVDKKSTETYLVKINGRTTLQVIIELDPETGYELDSKVQDYDNPSAVVDADVASDVMDYIWDLHV